MEAWKPVVGYEGRYEVSNEGRVRSVAREIIDALGRTRRFRARVLAESFISGNPDHMVQLWDGRASRAYRINAIMKEAFYGVPRGKLRHQFRLKGSRRLTADEIAQAKVLRANGMSVADMARLAQIPYQTFYKQIWSPTSE